MKRRMFLCVPVSSLLAGCGSFEGPGAAPRADLGEIRKTLAPTGTLRIAVLPGSPSSLVRDRSSGEERGVAVELGRELARRLQVDARLVEYGAFAAVAGALTDGSADIASFNAGSALASRVSLTPALFTQESGYLARPGHAAADGAALDRTGTRIGVQANSTSQATLATVLKQANVVPVGRLQDVPGLLSRGELDAFASNKAILHDVADQVPGARLLPGAYAIERQCLAIPRGRESALPFLEDFVRQCVRSGLVAGAAERAKLRGVTFGER